MRAMQMMRAMQSPEPLAVIATTIESGIPSQRRDQPAR
jgi:hypothetical protein